MTWRDILDIKSSHITFHLKDAVKHAVELGYRFLNWNGCIFFVDETGIAHDTGLKAENIQ